MNAITCRIPGCDGYSHAYGGCTVDLAELTVGERAKVYMEHSAYEDEAPAIVVFGFGAFTDSADRLTDPAEVRALAARYRAFADAMDHAASLLAPPAPVVKPELVDYAARFAALDVDTLFGLEDQGDCDNVDRYIESLLIVLAEWRPRVVAMLADAPEWAVPEAAAYRRALDRTREAYMQWSFRWEGGPDLPDTFDLPAEGSRPTVAPVVRISSAGRRDLVVQGVAA